MNIKEKLTISANNLLIYSSRLKKTAVLDLAKYICDNLNVLGLEQNGHIIFDMLSENKDEAEVKMIIPVKGKVMDCDHYGYQPDFSISNAVSARYEGEFAGLNQAAAKLKNYIAINNYTSVTDTYYMVIYSDGKDHENCVIDIFIGVDEKTKEISKA